MKRIFDAHCLVGLLVERSVLSPSRSLDRKTIREDKTRSKSTFTILAYIKRLSR